MADILLDVQSAPATPAAGQAVGYVDSTLKRWSTKDDTGRARNYADTGLFVDVVDTYGAKGDMRTVFDGACNVGLPDKIDSATMAFVAADVGKRITLAFAGASGAMYAGTITAVDSATRVTVSPNISSTTSARGLSIGTDDTTAWQNAINAVQNLTYPGGMIVVRQTETNRFMITSSLTATKGGWTIMGIGRAHTSDIGDYTKSGGSWLCWNGITSAILLQIAPVAGASNTALQAPRVFGVAFDCRNGDQNQALYGVQMLSSHGFHLGDFFISDALAVGLDLGVIQGALGEAKDNTRGKLDTFCIRELDKDPAVTLGSTTTTGTGTFTVAPFSLAITSGANFTTAGFCWVQSNLGYPVLVQYTGGGGTTTLTGCTVDAQEVINAPTWVAGSNVVQCSPSNACCIRADGVTTANTCLSTLLLAQLSHGTTWGPAAIELRNTDSWNIIQPIINGGNATNDGAINGIRKPGVRFCGSNSAATLAARNNAFKGGSAGAGGVSVVGVLNTGVRLLAMPGPNHWDLMEMGNGEPVPVVTGNAHFDWNPNGGLRYGQRGAASIADQVIPAATLTQLTGSLIAVPPQGFQLGTKFRWKFRGSKSAAGTAVRNFFIKIGTAGTTADGTVATFLSLGTVTAAIDIGDWEVEFTVRGPLGATCAGVAHLVMKHQLAATGLSSNNPDVNVGTMATWNSATVQQFIAMYLTTGASEVITMQSCGVECINPANP